MQKLRIEQKLEQAFVEAKEQLLFCGLSEYEVVHKSNREGPCVALFVDREVKDVALIEVMAKALLE